MPEPYEEELTNGDNEAQPATGQQNLSEEDQLATGRTPGDTPAQPAPDAQAQTEEPMIPKSRLDEISQKAAEAEARAAALEQQMAFIQASQQHGQQLQQPQPPQPEPDPYADYEDYDYVPLEAARERDKALTQTFMGHITTLQNQVFELTHPNFQEVVGKQNPLTGQFEMSQHLQNALTKNPIAVQALRSLPNQQAMREMAYTLAKGEYESAQQATAQQQQTNAAANQMYVDNTVSARTGPNPASSVGGDGGVNQAVNTEAMSRAEFDEYEQRVLAGEFD